LDDPTLDLRAVLAKTPKIMALKCVSAGKMLSIAWGLTAQQNKVD